MDAPTYPIHASYFDELLEYFEPVLNAIARSFARKCKASQDDLCQEARIRLWTALSREKPKFNSRNHFAAWIRRVATNAMLQWLRSAKRFTVCDNGLAPSEPQTECEQLTSHQAVVLENWIGQLDPSDAEYLRLSFFEGHSDSEIAVIRGVSRSAISQKRSHLLNSALHNLRAA